MSIFESFFRKPEIGSHWNTSQPVDNITWRSSECEHRLGPFSLDRTLWVQGYQFGSVEGLLQEFQTSAECRRVYLPDPDDGELPDAACRSLINEFSEVFQAGFIMKPCQGWIYKPSESEGLHF
ncbi:hypothetical protein C1H46_016135 [Malus baccata]|uniref:Uncharacterized protein n=1 Tax=Malus baccata TaxID=106549 RepID=A0A540MHW3_MALBA|nr:hypothetical protein C1H46_016135 [Malus baccata]